MHEVAHLPDDGTLNPGDGFIFELQSVCDYDIGLIEKNPSLDASLNSAHLILCSISLLI